MTPLRQPWKEYLAQKARMEQGQQGIVVIPKKPEPENGDTQLCPGGEECGTGPHPLGSTVSCAFRSHMACEVVTQGTTGTSG